VTVAAPKAASRRSSLPPEAKNLAQVQARIAIQGALRGSDRRRAVAAGAVRRSSQTVQLAPRVRTRRRAVRTTEVRG